VVSLVASRWQGKKETTPPVSVTVTQTQNAGAQVAQPTKAVRRSDRGMPLL